MNRIKQIVIENHLFMKYKVYINIKKNKYITVERWYNKCTRNVRPFPLYRTESRRFFPDRHILINIIKNADKAIADIVSAEKIINDVFSYSENV